MSNEKLKKGCHCAWQIHYRIVFPVKYPKASLDPEVVKVIQEAGEGIAERDSIGMEAIGCYKDHIHLPCGSHRKVARRRIVRVF